jgi:4-amino-4-deoxy-L-arabinose transferase-like glycosyltransferase
MNVGTIFLVLVALIVTGFWGGIISSHFNKSDKLTVACRLAMYVGLFGLFLFVWIQRKGPVWLIMAIAVLGWIAVVLYVAYRQRLTSDTGRGARRSSRSSPR